jgi:hypothetical protein
MFKELLKVFNEMMESEMSGIAAKQILGDDILHAYARIIYKGLLAYLYKHWGRGEEIRRAFMQKAPADLQQLAASLKEIPGHERAGRLLAELPEETLSTIIGIIVAARAMR